MVVFIGLLIFILYVFLGQGITWFIVPPQLKKYSFSLAPVVGYGYLTLVTWYTYRFNLPGIASYAPYLLLVPAVLLILMLIDIRRFKYEFEVKENIIALAITGLCIVLLSIPLWFQDGLTTCVLSNNDIADSATISNYLKSYSKMESTGFLGQTAAFVKLAEREIFGGTAAAAFISTILRLDVYKIQSVNLIACFSFSIMILYSFAKNIYRYSTSNAVLTVLVCSVNPITLYLVYQGFQGQILGMGISAAIMFIALVGFDKHDELMRKIRYIPVLVLLNWSLFVTYNHMLPLVYFPVVIYMAWSGWAHKDYRRTLIWMSFLGIALLAVFFMSPIKTKAFFEMMIQRGTAEAGWFIPLFFPARMTRYLTNHFSMYGIDKGMYVTIFFIALTIMAILFRNAFRKNKDIFRWGMTSCSVILFEYILLGFFGRQTGIWGGYKSFKLVSFFLPIVILGIFIGVEGTLVSIRKIKVKMQTGLLIGIILINIIISLTVIEKIINSGQCVSKDLAGIKTIQSMSDIHSVNIISKDWWEILWTTNFLMEKKLYFTTSTYCGRNASDLNGDWDLINVKSDPNSIKSTDQTRTINNTYCLRLRKGNNSE